MNNRRNLLVNKSDEEFVDLGLPSGLLWAKGNLKKSGNTCVIGKETDWGDFWSWANVGLTNDTGWMDSAGGIMTREMYDSTTGANQNQNISRADASHDVAYKYLGSPWRLPTKAEFDELRVNTDTEYVTINGVGGYKYMKKTDHSVYVFLPYSGYCNDAGLYLNGSHGYGSLYWSSTYKSGSEAYGMSEAGRYVGGSIRPVQSPNRTVTITVTGSAVAGVNLTLTDSEGVQHTSTTNVSGTAEFTFVAYGSATLSADEKEFNPNPITVSASEGSFTVEMFQVYVDLGLPSGLKWCRHNIGGTNPEDYGYYFSWGNVYGWKKGSGYNFSQSAYNGTVGSKLTGNIPANGSYDIARKVMGSPWRLPTEAEYEELYNNTDNTWVSNYNGTGVVGRKFMKKSDHSVYIFFPACGVYGGNNSITDNQGGGYYWSSTLYNSKTAAYCLYIRSGYVYPNYNESRYWGLTGRAVQ